MTPWQRFKAQTKIDNAVKGVEEAPPSNPPAARTPRKLLRNFPDIDEDQLRRLNAYCGHSYETTAMFLGNFALENLDPAEVAALGGGWAEGGEASIKQGA